MKKYAVIFVLCLIASLAIAGPRTNITSYFSGYVCTTSDWASAGDTGLGVGTNYICFPIDDIPRLSYARAVNTNSQDHAADIMRALIKAFYDQQELLVSTNQLSTFSISKSVVSSSGTADYVEKYSIEAEIEDTTTGSFVEEE